MQDFLLRIPESPGVYKMKDAGGKVIYVGKSIHLKNRVLSYFRDKNALNAAKRQMVERIRDIETITTRTGTEALVLETNLIKELRPKYNVLMKDDKDLAYIRVSDWPVRSVEKTRLRGNSGKYFGPYPSWIRITSTLESLRRIFKVRSCRMTFEREWENEAPDTSPKKSPSIRIVSKAGRSVPCMDHYIGICPAPCLLKKEMLVAHEENVERMERFLKGEYDEVLESLRWEMAEHSKALRFEEAGKTKERIESLSLLSERQIARNEIQEEADVLVTTERNGRNYVGFCRIRSTELRSLERHGTENPLSENENIAGIRFLSDMYTWSENYPKILLLEKPLEDSEFEAFLLENGIALEYPKIGAKAELLRFLKTNLAEYALKDGMEKIAARAANRDTMVAILQEIFRDSHIDSGEFRKGPLTFECYDISHTDGHFTVASRVTVTNGKADTSKYRKYKIKTLSDGEIDDFASLREVLYRRTLEGFEAKNFPTMLVIDGGKGQLSAAREWIDRALKEVWVMDLPFLASLAKREEEIFTETASESIRFKKGSAELSLLQRLRDEAHRFAISFNRTKRSKAMKKNLLEELPGFGPVTRKKLLALTGSIEGIREMDRRELEKILNKTQIETLQGHGLLE